MPAVPSSSSLLPKFNDEVSPWNTRQSMRTSDDVAQLLVSDRIVVSVAGCVPFSRIKRFCTSFGSLAAFTMPLSAQELNKYWRIKCR